MSLVAAKNKVLVFGGATGNATEYQITDDAYLFNTETKVWFKLKSKKLLS